MLGRDHRLTSGRDFGHVIRRGRRAGTPTVVVHLLVDAQKQPPRVGLVVGRSVGTAVVRNRVKRRLRHLMRERLETLPDGALVVLRALPAVAEASSAQLGADLQRALGRLQAGVRA